MICPNEKLNQARDNLYRHFPEREGPIDGLFTSLIAGAHTLLLGPPGTGKSMMVRAFSGAVSADGNFFQYLLNKTTTPEEIFGPVSFSGLKNDEFWRVTTGKLPEAEVVFLDEIWKSSSHIVQSLLTALNERLFFNGKDTVRIPLLSCVGASNEYPEEGEGLEAVFDRFQLRFWVDYISDNDLLSSLLVDQSAGELPHISEPLTREDVEELRRKAKEMEFTSDDAEVLITLKHTLEEEGFIVSDRTWIRSPLLLKARAVYNGHDKVTPADYRVLADSLWADHTARPKLFELISKVCNPVDAKVCKLADAFSELMNTVPDLNELKNDPSKIPDAAGDILRIKKEIGGMTRKTEALIEKFGEDDQVLELQNALSEANTILAQRIQEISNL